MTELPNRMVPETAEPAVPAPPKAARSVGDLVATIVLLLVMVPVGLVVSLYGAFIAMGSSCYGANCNSVLIAVGIVVATIGPLVIGVLGLVFAIVRLIQRRRAFGAPLLAMAGMAVVWLIGYGLASAGIG